MLSGSGEQCRSATQSMAWRPFLTQLSVRSPLCPRCDCRMSISTRVFDGAGIFASGRVCVIHMLTQSARAARHRRHCSSASSPTWHSALVRRLCGGLGADGHCIPGRLYACLGASGQLLLDVFHAYCLSRALSLPRAHMLSDAANHLASGSLVRCSGAGST